MYLTLDEAMAKVDLQPEAVTKAVKSGKVRGLQAPNGDWLVDAASLLNEFRTFLRVHQEPVLVVQKDIENRPRAIQHLQELLDLERQRSADLKQERDRWAALVERLAHPQNPIHLPLAPAATSS